MKTKQRKAAARGWLWRVFLVVFAAILFVKGVQLYVQQEEKNRQLAAVQDSIIKQTLINEDLQEQIDNVDDYVERYANEAGFVLPGQQIYQSTEG